MAILGIIYFLVTPNLLNNNTNYRLKKSLKDEEYNENTKGYDFRYEINENILDQNNCSRIFNRPKFFKEDSYLTKEIYDKHNLLKTLEIVKNKINIRYPLSDEYLVNYLSMYNIDIFNELIKQKLDVVKNCKDIVADFYSNPFSSTNDSLDDFDSNDV